MPADSFSRVLLLACAGPIVWALHLLVIYGFTGVVCARPRADWQWLGWPATSWVVGLAGAVALVLIAAFSAKAWGGRQGPGDARFIAYTAVGLGLLSALAVAWETVTIWLVPGCV